MSRKTKAVRAPRGSVQARSRRGGVELRWTVGGKRYEFCPGLPDTTHGLYQANQLAKKIQRDIEFGEFDPTLEKYRHSSDKPIALPAVPTLGDLWQQYTEHKATQIEESTLIRDYGRVAKRIAAFPSQELEDAIAIEKYLLKTFSTETARRTLQAINGCCNWARDRGLIEKTPFQSMKVRSRRKSKSKRTLKAFSTKERDLIIEALAKL
jgi:integrase